MAEETTAAVEEERELASQPIPGLVRKYTIITGQGMLAQIIMVVLEGLVMGWGLGAHGLACVSIIMSVEYINLAFGNLFGTRACRRGGQPFGCPATLRAPARRLARVFGLPRL